MANLSYGYDAIAINAVQDVCKDGTIVVMLTTTTLKTLMQLPIERGWLSGCLLQPFSRFLQPLLVHRLQEL